MLDGVELTWLGHATFLMEAPNGREILVDPWLDSNPSCPEDYTDVESDAILVTHGHQDHVVDVFDAEQRCTGPVVAQVELVEWFKTKGMDESIVRPMNKGGTVPLDGMEVSVTMTDAKHSSSTVEDGEVVELGTPAGFVVDFADSGTLYIAGDTSLFGDMELIGDYYDPDAAILPIGDRFTMDPKAAAKACELLGVDAAVPCHWGTFDLLTGRPEAFERHLDQMEVATEPVVLDPGEAV